jgi:hypothetical protein
MKNMMYCLCFMIFLLISCGGNENNIPMFGYELGNRKIQKLKLNINKTDAIVNFEYLHKSDSLKNIRLKHHRKEDIIIVTLDTFNKITNRYKSSNLMFEMYQNKEVENLNKTFVFHEDYGLLASLGFGVDRVFLTDSISPNVKEFIFKDLFINLNKINIE